MNAMRHTLSAQAGLLGELLTAVMEPKLEETGLSLGTFELLSAVHASGGKATQVEVARRLGITPPSLSESVKSATAKSLIEQHADSDDGRRKILKLTPTGRNAMVSIVKGVNKAETRMVHGIEESQLTQVIEVLTKVNRNLARILEEETESTKGAKSKANRRNAK
jgi:MarR family transcriptional regulator for hemolysin